MANVLRRTADSAGGTISGGSTNCLIDGYGVARNGDSVTPHSTGVHLAAQMVAATNTKVKCDGILVCVVGDFATCGDAGGTGSTNVQIMP